MSLQNLQRIQRMQAKLDAVLADDDFKGFWTRIMLCGNQAVLRIGTDITDLHKSGLEVEPGDDVLSIRVHGVNCDEHTPQS